jgi:thiaminase
MASLTEHLLSLDPALLDKATTHPFLEKAATASLPKSNLTHWLGQDRLYAISYINFIGSLLSQLHMPGTMTANPTSNNSANLEWRTADALIDCLTNIRREIQLFERMASGEGILEEIREVREERATRCYKDLFAGATAGGKPSLVGLVILWGSEVCYLKAWRFARTFLNVEDGNGDVMQRVFIPNWSDDAFEEFVGRLGELVNDWGIVYGDVVRKECEDAFRQVLWCERDFWPDV